MLFYTAVTEGGAEGLLEQDVCVFSMISSMCKKLWYGVLAAVLVPSLAVAVTVEDLYQAAQPVAGSQDAAFVEALRVVAIRVSGRRDAPERLGSALRNARQLVQRYGITQDNVLQVGFDDVSVDRMLIEAGLPIWGRERPETLVVLNLDDVGAGWFSADLPPVDQERLADVARERGLPLQFGTLGREDENLLSMGDGASASLLQIARRNGANAILVGRGTRAGSLRWILATADGVTQSVGTFEDAIHSTADHFARLFAAEGSTLSRVRVEVSGITDLDAYASTLNYLEGMTLVRSVAVQQVMGDTMEFELAVRGDAATLQRAIALDPRLVPTQAGAMQPNPMASDMAPPVEGPHETGQAPRGRSTVARLAFRYQK